jgi:hypothetical protein
MVTAMLILGIIKMEIEVMETTKKEVKMIIK